MPAPTIDELLLGDDGAHWAALGFDVTDGCCRIGRVRLRFLPHSPERGLLGWSLRDLARVNLDAVDPDAADPDEVELDGLPTSISHQPLADSAPAHPNGIVAIDHIVAMSPALDHSVAQLRQAGLDLRRIREQPTPAGAPRQAFFRLGAEILELIQEPTDAIERSGGPDRPARFWGLALVAEDLERTVELLGAHAGPIRPAIQPGRRIATVRRSAGLSIPLALMSGRETGG